MSKPTQRYEEYESVDLTEDERSSEENFLDESNPLNFVSCNLDSSSETSSSTFASSSPLSLLRANRILPREFPKEALKNVPNLIKKRETITSQPIVSHRKVKKLSPAKPRPNILAETQDVVDVDSMTTETVCVALDTEKRELPTQNAPVRYQIAQSQTTYSQKQPGKVVIIKKNNKYYKIVIPHNVMPNINQSTGPVLINIPEVGPLVIRSDPHITKPDSVPVDQPFSLNLDDVRQSQSKNNVQPAVAPKKVPEVSWKEAALCNKRFCWTLTKGRKRDLEGFSYNDRLGFTRAEYHRARKCAGILDSIVKKKRSEIIDQMHNFNIFKNSVDENTEDKLVKKKPVSRGAAKKRTTKTKFESHGSRSPPPLPENFKETNMALEAMSYSPKSIHSPSNETDGDNDYDCDLLMTKKVVILNGKDTKPVAKKRKAKGRNLTRPKRKISNKVKLKRIWAKKLAQHKEIMAKNNNAFMLKPCYVEMVRDDSVEEAYRNYMGNMGFNCKPQTYVNSDNTTKVGRLKANTNLKASFYPRTIETQKSARMGTNCDQSFSNTIEILKSRIIASVGEFKKEINYLKPLLIVNEHNLGVLNYSTQFAKSNIIYVVKENTPFPISILKNEDFIAAFELGYLKLVDAQLFCKYIMGSEMFNSPVANKHVSDHNYCRSKNKRV